MSIIKKAISILSLMIFLFTGCAKTNNNFANSSNEIVSSTIAKEENIVSNKEENSSQAEEEVSSETPNSTPPSANSNSTPVPNKVNVWCAPPVVDENTLHPIVIEARKHLGNYNGDMFWQWYGFNSYTAWCACFVSYCAAETNVDIPKFAWVPNGEQYFKSIDKWEPRGDYVPKSGDIIFFAYNGWQEGCHVGIVECVVGNRVYTIEGNYNNSCQRANYPLNWHTIFGYGVI